MLSVLPQHHQEVILITRILTIIVYPNRMNEWFVYVVRNTGDILYTGITKDTARRIDEHNKGCGAKFTRGRGPWKLAYSEGPFDHGDALRREMAIKKDASLKREIKARPL